MARLAYKPVYTMADSTRYFYDPIYSISNIEMEIKMTGVIISGIRLFFSLILSKQIYVAEEDKRKYIR